MNWGFRVKGLLGFQPFPGVLGFWVQGCEELGIQG